MSKVTKIDAVKSSKIAAKKIRVAAYCRVSTDSDAQLESLDAQRKHYEKHIRARDDWEFAGLYFDEGITGTKKDKRPDLLRMIADCKAGKIDMVITKSISRFSRNTTDCLEMVRALLELDIPIYFEKENLNTASMESELFLSILSSMAESESVSIAANSNWSIQKRFENGSYKVSYPPYGYDWNGTEMVINPEQAAVVKEVFNAALSGKSTNAIADDLNRSGIPTKRDGSWHATTIRGMLSNEKYTGDCLFQKTYTDSAFNRHTNYDNRTQYLIEEHHEPIVSHETFDAVQVLIDQHAKEKGVVKRAEKYQNRYAFSGKIICGECGDVFKRRIHYIHDDSYIAWCCTTHLEHKEQCSMLYVRDDDLKLAFVAMMNKLVFAHRLILRPYVDDLIGASQDGNANRIQQLQTKIAQNNEKKETLTRLMAQKVIDQILYTKEVNELMAHSARCRAEIERLNNALSGESEKAAEAKALLSFASKGVMLDDFDDDLFSKFVDRIVIKARNTACFELKCGLNLTERIG